MAKFKVGDIVKPTDPKTFRSHFCDTASYLNLKGIDNETFTVRQVNDNFYKLEEASFDLKGSVDQWFISDWFELVKAKEEKEPEMELPSMELIEPKDSRSDLEVIKLADLPLGRIGKVVRPLVNVYIACCVNKEYLSVWPEELDKRVSIQSLAKGEYMPNWELQLLPVGTSVTLTFNGPHEWQGD